MASCTAIWRVRCKSSAHEIRLIVGRSHCTNFTSEQRGHSNNHNVKDDVCSYETEFEAVVDPPCRKIIVTKADPWTGTTAAPELLPCGLAGSASKPFFDVMTGKLLRSLAVLSTLGGCTRRLQKPVKVMDE